MVILVKCCRALLSLEIGVPSNAEMALLANSIATHTTLTSLSFTPSTPGRFSDSQLQNVCQNLPCSLKGLRIQGNFKAPSVEALAHALWVLPMLEHLSISEVALHEVPVAVAQAIGQCFVEVSTLLSWRSQRLVPVVPANTILLSQSAGY